MEPEDVVHVLHNMVAAVKPGGLLLDLQVIRPDPVVESDGAVVCTIDGEPLFRSADAAAAAIDAMVADGELIEQAVDDHDVLNHYPNGRELVDDFADKQRTLRDEEAVRALAGPCAIRERCRLRRLLVV